MCVGLIQQQNETKLQENMDGMKRSYALHHGSLAMVANKQNTHAHTENPMQKQLSSYER